MDIYQDIENLPLFNHAVITIGSFDGVHLGHLQIIRQLQEEAAKINGTGVLITFYPHPKQVVGKEMSAHFTLNTPEEKAALLEQAGVEKLVITPFDQKFSEQTAYEYIRDFLVKKFSPHTIIIGYDHRFGKDRLGDYVLLEKHSIEFGYRVKEIPEHVLRNITISSTQIRKSLGIGDIRGANELLGYEYFFSGIVTEGNKLGRTIGFPTANLLIEDQKKLLPANGVYAVRLVIENDNQPYFGMMNIGVRPTLGGNTRAIEVNIFNFDRLIYGRKINVTVVEKIRDEQKFGTLDDLKKQLYADREASRLLLL